MREFWIEFGGDPSDDKEVYKRYCAAVPFNPADFSDEVIHVIEKSAYDRVMRELGDLKASMRSWEVAREIEILANSDREWNQLIEERDRYRSALERIRQGVHIIEAIAISDEALK